MDRNREPAASLDERIQAGILAVSNAALDVWDGIEADIAGAVMVSVLDILAVELSAFRDLEAMEAECPACGEFIDYCQGHGELVARVNRMEAASALSMPGNADGMTAARVLLDGILMDTGNYEGYRVDMETGKRTYRTNERTVS